MLLGIFGDIHGDLEALDTVIGRLQREGVTDHLCLGDVVNLFQHAGGQRNQECISRIESLECPVIRGNHDIGYSKDRRVDPAIRHRLSAYRLTYQSLDCRIVAAHTTWRYPQDAFSRSGGNSYEAELEEVGRDVTDLELLLLGHRHTPLLLRRERQGGDTIVMLGDALPEGHQVVFGLDVEHYQYLLVPGAVSCPHAKAVRGYGAVYDTVRHRLLMFQEDMSP